MCCGCLHLNWLPTWGRIRISSIGKILRSLGSQSDKGSCRLSTRLNLWVRIFACRSAHILHLQPYHTHLTISGIPAELRIEIFNPQTGNIYHGGQTHGGTVFSTPSQFVGDYLLYITERTAPQ
jgi:hypothetical protein